MASNQNSAELTKALRSSAQGSFHTVCMDVSEDGCRLAVSGYKNKTNETFIDLFALHKDPDSPDIWLLMTSKPYFSKTFTKIGGLSRRCVCLLDDSVFVMCCGNTIESYDTERGRLVNQRQFTGEAFCMTTTRDGRVYVGLELSNDVLVFDSRLNHMNTITLEGSGGWPEDIIVNNNKLFICTFNGRAVMCSINGVIEYEFKEPNHQYRTALSITVNKENGLIYILWWDGGEGKCVVVVYSLLVDHSSLSGCHFLASFDVSDYSFRIRINYNVNRLFVVTRETGKVYEYHTNDIISLQNLLTLIELLIDKDDCQKLLNYFKVPSRKAKAIKNSYEPSKTLLQHLVKTGKVSDGLLLAACNDQGMSHVADALNNYKQFLSCKEQLPLLYLKQSENQLTETLTDSENDRQELTNRLKEIQIEKEELAERLTIGEKQKQQVTDKLRESENERVRLTKRLKTEGEERRELTDRLVREEEERRELTDRLKEITEKHQQLESRLNAAETEKKHLTDKLRELYYEKQQLSARLEVTEKGEQQLEERLKAKIKEEQQVSTRLKVTKEEKKEVTSRVTGSDEERSQLTGRLQTIEKERTQLEERSKTTEEENEQLVKRLATTESERQHLSNRLSTTEKELQYLYDEEKMLKRKMEENQQELEETKSILRAAKDELVKAQVKYAKESMALQEVLQQTRETLSKQAITSKYSLEEEHTLPKENETSEVSQESAALAADYGRLVVDVADDLTLDNTLKLAYLFKLSVSEKDRLRRISLIETPGITLINFMKTKNIINMYDVTNLRKGLRHLHLYSTNTKYVVPYQQKVDPFQFEENRSPDLVDWPDEETEAPKANETSFSQEYERTEESEEPQNDPDEERLTEKIDREDKPRPREDSQITQITQPYIEHKINDEGGTITLMGVCLSIPDEALSRDHIIAVTVIRDPDVLLPGSAQRGRMTDLIKLEPEGLKLNRPARLTIPHSAIIPEPDRHNVIIFTGQPSQRESQKGHITWAEEKSLKSKLEQEKISLDISTLSYVFVNLVGQEMEQKHMFRVVPFIDGILDAKDDVLITVCFCKDNDAEYQLLVDDCKSKLILGSYMTFQVSRTFTGEKDGVSYLGLTMSPQIDSYHLTEGEAAKIIDIDHLCAASRVSLQFRLQRRKDGDDEMVDVKLEVSQGEKNKIDLILQSKVKNILLSKESQDLLHQGLSKDLHLYGKLKQTVSNLLEKEHCEKLATVFELTPAERDTVLNDSNPGMVLVKILDQRELIMPDKVFGLYQGLKASHLDKIGRHVLEYIDASKKEKVNDSKSVQEVKKEANRKEDLQEKDFKLSRNVISLIDEGYKRLDIQRALKLSHGKLDLGRRILLLAKDEHERLPLLPGTNVYKEQYIDELGGELHIAGIHLLVPAGALDTGRIVSLSVSTEAGIKGPISNRSLRVTPLVKFGPVNLVIHKPAVMIIPHCAYITSTQTGLDVFSGMPQKDKKMKWTIERKFLSCSMNNNNLRIEIHRPCGLIGPHIPFQQKMRKHICVIPIMKRSHSLMDELTICLCFYNDGILEHDSLVHEEVYNNRGIVLHDPVSFQVKTMGATLPVSITSTNSQWNINPKEVEVDVNSLWLLDRHMVTFHLQAKNREDTVNLEIESRYGVARKLLFQLNCSFNVDDVHHCDQTTSPFQQVLPKFTMESLKKLLKKLSENLDAEQSIQLAKIFQLGEDAISSIETYKKPGNLLLEMLTKKYLVSASNISRFEYALTELGNEQCAKHVRDFRRLNPVVHATMFPEDDK